MNLKLTIKAIKGIFLDSENPRGKEAIENLKWVLDKYLNGDEERVLKVPKDLLLSAIEKWGIETQKDKIQEECQELALIMHQAKCPTKNEIESEEQTYKELADLQFVAQYIPLLYDQNRLNEINKQRIIDFKNKYEL